VGPQASQAPRHRLSSRRVLALMHNAAAEGGGDGAGAEGAVGGGEGRGLPLLGDPRWPPMVSPWRVEDRKGAMSLAVAVSSCLLGGRRVELEPGSGGGALDGAVPGEGARAVSPGAVGDTSAGGGAGGLAPPGGSRFVASRSAAVPTAMAAVAPPATKAGRWARQVSRSRTAMAARPPPR
jgi:hypothetical protein